MPPPKKESVKAPQPQPKKPAQNQPVRPPQNQPMRAQQARPKNPPREVMYNLQTFDMPGQIMRVGYRYHTGLGQFEKLFFVIFRFSVTLLWGMNIYGAATGDAGGMSTSEDQKLWVSVEKLCLNS